MLPSDLTNHVDHNTADEWRDIQTARTVLRETADTARVAAEHSGLSTP